MHTSVNDVLSRRSRSRLYTGRCCIISEKRAKVFAMFILAAGLAIYAYEEVVTMMKAYAKPSREVQNPLLSSITLPGLLICAPFTNLSDTSLLWNGQLNTLYGSPRESMAPFVHTNSPVYNNLPFLMDCCLTSQFDFFTSCFSTGSTCPVPARFRQKMYGELLTEGVTWKLTFSCIDISPGLKFYKSSDNLFIPFYNTWDNGIFATETNLNGTEQKDYHALPHPISNATDPFNDVDFRYFSNNFQYWTSKYVVFSYMPSENTTNPVDIYFGNKGVDALIGGPQNRIRTDIGRGITSVLLSHYKYWDVTGNLVVGRTGWTTSYDLTLASLPWTIATSSFDSRRQRAAELGWLRVHIDLHEQQTREFISFTYLSLITAFLTIIGSATTLSHIIIGRGEYDPTGLLNKLFYYDVPVLKEAATDVAAEAVAGGGDTKKSKRNDDSDHDAETH